MYTIFPSGELLTGSVRERRTGDGEVIVNQILAYRNGYRMRPPQGLSGLTSGVYWTLVQRQIHLFPTFFADDS